MLTHYSQLQQNGQCGANMIVAVFDNFLDIFVEVRILFDNYYTNFGGNNCNCTIPVAIIIIYREGGILSEESAYTALRRVCSYFV